jgi:hypothetical protein
MSPGHLQEIKSNLNHINNINNPLNNSQSLSIKLSRISVSITAIIIECHGLILSWKDENKRHNNEFIQNKERDKEVPELAKTLIRVDQIPRRIIVIVFDL